MKVRFFILIFIFLLLAACAPKVTVVNEKGKQLPKSSYEVNDLRGRFNCNFYYVEVEEGKDKDGTPIKTPINYMRIFEDQKLQYKTNKVYMILEVSNPRRVHYNLIEDKRVVSINNYKVVDKKDVVKIAESDLSYRQYIFELPAEKFNRIEYELKLFVGNEFVFTFGELRYTPNS